MFRGEKQTYRFDEFMLEADEHRLRRGSQEIFLRPKPLETLRYLIERRHRLIKKDELLNALWADAFVTENALTQCIKEVREALSDDAYQPRFIKTIPRVGYKFIADVEEIFSGREQGEAIEEEFAGVRVLVIREDEGTPIGEAEEAATLADHAVVALPQQHQRRWTVSQGRVGWLALAACVVAAIGLTAYLRRPAPSAASIRSIAVLPFTALTADSRDAALELGMADTLITRLSAVRQVVVRPISDVRKYADLEQDPLAAGRELRVDSVLDGSIQSAGDRVRVTVRLVSVRDGTPIWAARFDEKLTDIFTIQDSIAERVAAKLLGTLTGEERKQLTRRHTDNAEAYQLYLKGRLYFYQYREATGWKALAYFREAREADPAYALAYAGEADVYAQASSKFFPPGEVMPLAKKAATRAMELDDTLAECHLSLAKVRWWGDWDSAGAESAFRRALEINPNDTHARREYARFLTQLGRFDEALAEIRQAQQLDPLSAHVIHTLGWISYYARQYDQAIAAYRQALSLDPNNASARYHLGLALAQKGMMEDAIAELERAIDLKDDYGYVSDLGYVYALAGNRGEALKRLAQLKERAKHKYVSPYHIARIYAGLGEKDEACRWLAKGYEDRSDHLLQLRVDPTFDTLRADPQFTDLLRHVGTHH